MTRFDYSLIYSAILWDRGKRLAVIGKPTCKYPYICHFYLRTKQAKYEIIDGHQPVGSITQYLNNEFALSGLGRTAGISKYAISPTSKTRAKIFENAHFSNYFDLDSSLDPNMKFEIFERLNTGAILLNSQELRNSLIYRGNFNELLHELARLASFRSLLGTRLPRRRMIDEELILRFFGHVRQDGGKSGAI